MEKLRTKASRRIHGFRKWRRWYKRYSAKLLRRLGKQGDDAPKRLPIRGWVD